MEKTITGETCLICDMEKNKGIHLYNSFICSECERELVKTETDDEQYQYYLNKLRKVIQPEICS